MSVSPSGTGPMVAENKSENPDDPGQEVEFEKTLLTVVVA